MFFLYEKFSFLCNLPPPPFSPSLAADIVERRLESARLMGADVIINCKTEDLKTRGTLHVLMPDCPTLAWYQSWVRLYLKVQTMGICFSNGGTVDICICGYFFLPVFQETGGDGIGRLFEATGAPSMVNNCFSLLRYAQFICLCSA